MNPNRQDRPFQPGQANESKRGVMSEFSCKSRRRLQRTLGTMKLAAVAFTMALTFPGGDVAGLGHGIVGNAFEKVLRRLSVRRRFAGVSGFWKRELQKRGAIHCHLLFYGLADDGLRTEFQSWMVAQWVSFFADGLDGKEREHHRWWHARPENMQLVRDFSGYWCPFFSNDAGNGVPTESTGIAGLWDGTRPGRVRIKKSCERACGQLGRMIGNQLSNGTLQMLRWTNASHLTHPPDQ